MNTPENDNWKPLDTLISSILKKAGESIIARQPPDVQEAYHAFLKGGSQGFFAATVPVDDEPDGFDEPDCIVYE